MRIYKNNDVKEVFYPALFEGDTFEFEENSGIIFMRTPGDDSPGGWGLVHISLLSGQKFSISSFIAPQKPVYNVNKYYLVHEDDLPK